MYVCETNIYFVNCPYHTAEIIKKMPPLPQFGHKFMDSALPDAQKTSQADLIICGPDIPENEFSQITAAKKAGAEILALTLGETPPVILEYATDIWRMPLSDGELRFHFLRWQKIYKQSKDLWQTSQFLEKIMDTTPNLVWFKDKNGVHEIVNASFCRTVKKTRQQVQGQKHAYIWNVEKDDPACIESERIVMESGKTQISEEAIETGTGKRLLTTYKSPLHDIDGSMMGTLGIAVDITQDRIYKKKLLENNAELETIFTAMNCGILCHSLDGSRIIGINRAALRMLDFDSCEDMEASGFHFAASTVMEEDKPKLKKALSQLKNIGDSTNYEYRVVHADGNILHLLGNARLVEENGEIICRRFLMDCTAQKLAEKKEQNEKEKRQMELIRALSLDYQLVCFFDMNLSSEKILQFTLYPDRNLGRIFVGDLPLAQKMEKYIQTCVHPDDRDQFREACSIETLKTKLKGRRSYYFNYRALNGKNIHYFQLKAVCAGPQSDPYGIVIGFQSVDSRTRHEMRQKDQLADALKQAKKANNAKSIFLSNMSHDIRTPLNAIVGYTSLALTRLDSRSQVKEYLKKISSSSKHLISLINDILDMSHIESGKIQLDEKLHELPVLLRDFWNIVQPAANAKRQSLSIELEDIYNESIYCDKLRLNQILLNLLSNSVKYTKEGGKISILIKQLPCLPPDRAAYEFHIKDNGIGMSDDFLSRIFEPFERERTSTVAGIQGTGLGMAITKSIVDMMKGSIEVKSKQNIGTEFIFRVTFRLPCSPSSNLDADVIKNCKALIVEAETKFAENMESLLYENGLQYDLASSAEKALELMRGNTDCNYDLCIINENIPENGGLWLARQIREKTDKNCPVIVLTCGNWTEAQKKTAEADIDAYLGKPLFWSDLRACLLRGETDESGKNGTFKAEHTGHILMAEDNAMNQEIVVEFLTEAGYSVDTANNGQEAVEMLETSNPGYYDIILMDVQMPVMDGYSATRLIRNLEDASLASIPIIAMTANSFEEDKREALMHGMNGHIAKPIDFKILFKTLDKFLS